MTGSRKHTTQPSEVKNVEIRRVWCRVGGVRKILRPKIEEFACCVRPPSKDHSAALMFVRPMPASCGRPAAATAAAAASGT